MLSEEIAPHDDQEFTRIFEENRELRRVIEETEETLRNEQMRFVERVKYL